MSIDNGGAPGELITMWRAALRIQKILRSAGYIADLTKSSANENVGLLERVREAINDHATIAVSLHYTGGIPFGEANAHFGVTPQQVGRYRTNVSNGDTIRFTNTRVAAESQRDAKIIQRARAAAGNGVDVAPLDESFPNPGSARVRQHLNRPGRRPAVPWIFNEDGDIGFNFHAYATGIANGIERAVPIAPCSRASPTPAITRSRRGGRRPQQPSAASGRTRRSVPPECVRATEVGSDRVVYLRADSLEAVDVSACTGRSRSELLEEVVVAV